MGALRRVSSLVLDVVVPRSVAEGNHDGETIPDSEEERMHEKRPVNSLNTTVIEISSDEEDAKENVNMSRIPLIGKKRVAFPVEASPVKGPANQQNIKIFTKARDLATESKLPVKSSPRIQIIRSRQVVQSSSSECSESDSDHSIVNELNDTSPKRPTRTAITPERKPVSVPTKVGPAIHAQSTASTSLSLYVDDDPSEDDGAVLILNEPKSARKPLRTPKLPGGYAITSEKIVPQGTPVKDDHADSESSASESDDVTSTLIERISTPSGTARSPTKQKAPRQTKATRTRAELKRREAYAQALFVELNRDVFDNGLPKETELAWNKRLLTTAGRAKWHRNREGVETTSIELAVKILDCDERIRNTLSHEMCHLASWYINGESQEVHGNVWKGWASRVMGRRPDIMISTKHNYEIAYPYQWKCETCAKIYGRFSKSIRPNECVCGACRIGKLIPQFTVRSKGIPKTTADSRLAADRAQDSPCSINGASTEGATPTRTSMRPSIDPVVCLVDDSDDDGIEMLATMLGGGLGLTE